PGKTAYPISSFTWILLYKNPPNQAKCKQLIDFLRWAIHDVEKEAPSLDYAPLPPSMVTMLVVPAARAQQYQKDSTKADTAATKPKTPALDFSGWVFGNYQYETDAA